MPSPSSLYICPVVLSHILMYTYCIYPSSLIIILILNSLLTSQHQTCWKPVGRLR